MTVLAERADSSAPSVKRVRLYYPGAEPISLNYLPMATPLDADEFVVTTKSPKKPATPQANPTRLAPLSPSTPTSPAPLPQGKRADSRIPRPVSAPTLSPHSPAKPDIPFEQTSEYKLKMVLEDLYNINLVDSTTGLSPPAAPPARPTRIAPPPPPTIETQPAPPPRRKRADSPFPRPVSTLPIKTQPAPPRPKRADSSHPRPVSALPKARQSSSAVPHTHSNPDIPVQEFSEFNLQDFFDLELVEPTTGLNTPAAPPASPTRFAGFTGFDPLPPPTTDPQPASLPWQQNPVFDLVEARQRSSAIPIASTSTDSATLFQKTSEYDLMVYLQDYYNLMEVKKKAADPLKTEALAQAILGDKKESSVMLNGYGGLVDTHKTHSPDDSSPNTEGVSPVATLCNLGNTCFLNSVLYTLRFAPHFLHNLHHLALDLVEYSGRYSHLKSKSSSLGRGIGGGSKSWSNKDLTTMGQSVTQDDKIAVATLRLHELYESLHNAELKDHIEPFQPEIFLTALREVNAIFEGNQQHDAHELLVCLLDNIRETCQQLSQLSERQGRIRGPPPPSGPPSCPPPPAKSSFSSNVRKSLKLGKTKSNGVLDKKAVISAAKEGPLVEPCCFNPLEPEPESSSQPSEPLSHRSFEPNYLEYSKTMKNKSNARERELKNSNKLNKLRRSNSDTSLANLKYAAQKVGSLVVPWFFNPPEPEPQSSTQPTESHTSSEPSNLEYSKTIKKKSKARKRELKDSNKLNELRRSNSDTSLSILKYASQVGSLVAPWFFNPPEPEPQSPTQSTEPHTSSEPSNLEYSKTIKKKSKARKRELKNSNKLNELRRSNSDTCLANLKYAAQVGSLVVPCSFNPLESESSPQSSEPISLLHHSSEPSNLEHSETIEKELRRSCSDSDLLNLKGDGPLICDQAPGQNEEEGPRIGHNFIQEDFQGTMLLLTTCLECEQETSRKETFCDICVPITPPTGNCDENMSLLYHSAIVTVELLQDTNKYWCENCSRYNEAQRCVRYETLPRLLILQLKRFSSTFGSTVQKVNDYMPTPLTLSCFCIKCKDLEESRKPHRGYQLYGIIMHLGATMASGHYITYVRGRDTVIDCANCTRDKRKTASLSGGAGKPLTNPVAEKHTGLLRFFKCSKPTYPSALENRSTYYPPCRSADCCGVKLESTQEPVWLECDDDTVKIMTKKEFDDLLAPKKGSALTPYLLFYSRIQ